MAENNPVEKCLKLLFGIPFRDFIGKAETMGGVDYVRKVRWKCRATPNFNAAWRLGDAQHLDFRRHPAIYTAVLALQIIIATPLPSSRHQRSSLALSGTYVDNNQFAGYRSRDTLRGNNYTKINSHRVI